VSCQLHAPEVLPPPPGKQPRYPWIEGWWAPRPVWTWWRREIFPARAGNRTAAWRILRKMSHHRTLKTGPIPNELQQWRLSAARVSPHRKLLTFSLLEFIISSLILCRRMRFALFYPPSLPPSLTSNPSVLFLLSNAKSPSFLSSFSPQLLSHSHFTLPPFLFLYVFLSGITTHLLSLCRIIQFTVMSVSSYKASEWQHLLMIPGRPQSIDYGTNMADHAPCILRFYTARTPILCYLDFLFYTFG